MAERKIWYEPHPVSVERLAELRASGYQVIDAIYGSNESEPETDITKMSRAEIVAELAERGVNGATGKLKDLRNWLLRVRAE